MGIIIIGPRGVGKTTVAKIVSEKLCFNYVSLDDEEKNLHFSNRQTPEGRVDTVKNVFEKHYNIECVFDFGCFHSIYLDKKEHLYNEIYTLLLPESNVFLLTPSSNIDECEEFLNELNAQQISEPQLSMINKSNSNIVRSSQNERLAKHIIYTKSLKFEQIADLIISKATY